MERPRYFEDYELGEQRESAGRTITETDFVVLHLFSDDDGLRAATEMDRTVDGLPGLSGLRLFQRARAGAISRADAPGRAGHRAVRAGSCSTGS